MKRYIITCMAALMTVLYSQAESLSIGDVVMNQGDTTTIAISLTNSHTDLVSFQMDLYLPDGIAINKSGCSLSNRFESGQTLTIGKQTDGAYRLTSTSFSLTPITDTSGTIINLSLTALKETGATSASINNIMFATSSSERITLNNISFVAAVREHQSINISTLPSLTYGKTYTLPSKTEQGQELIWRVTNNDVATISDNVISTKGAGTTGVIATQAGTSIYLPLTKIYTLDVDKASLTIKAKDATRLYNDDDPTFEFTCSGFVNNDDVKAFTKLPDFVTDATRKSKVGKYNITPCYAEANNYEISYKQGILTIYAKNSSNLSIDDIPDIEYNGLAQTPEIVVRDGEKTLALGTDYNVTYSNNINVGRATATVTCKGNYTGTKYATFTIYAIEDVIRFADANVKAICVANWDTNGSGEISFEEAESVTDLGDVFKEKNIISFDEFKYFTSITSIPSDAFYGCSSLTAITIPNGVTSIGMSTFSGCKGLTSIEIPNSVTSIGYGAFSGCYSMSSIIIPNSVTSIGSDAFRGCSGLTSITIPNSVTLIDGCAFSGCSGLTSITIPNKVTSINYGTFRNCSALTAVTIPNSVTEIERSAFEGCSGLTSVTIGSGVTTIGQGAFSECSSLTSITIPNNVRGIEDRAFSGCSGMTSVEIPNNVTSIGESSFVGCSRLIKVVLNSNEVASKSYRSESSLKDIFGTQVKEYIIGDDVTAIGNYALYGTDLMTLIVGTGVLSFGSNAFSTKPVKTIWLTNSPPQNYTVAQGTINYVANNQYSSLSNMKEYKFLSSTFEVDGVRYVPVSPSERTCDVIDCVYNDSITEVSINPTVSYKGVSMTVQNVQPYTFYQNPFIKTARFDIDGSIGKYVFSGCNNLQTAVFGKNVTGIGEHSFSDCSKLESIIIPELVDTIGQYAFSNCSGMKSVVMGEGTNIIGQYAFSGCSSLSSVAIGKGTNSIGNYAFSGCTNLESISFGEGTETINQYAFQNCSSLPSITIPGSVNSIGNYAFNGCKGLKTVIMEDRKTDGELKLGYNGSNPLFVDCPLDSVYIGRNISYSTGSSYGYSPFYRNTSLRTVVITDKETEISENEFYGCTNLQNVQIGDGVTAIGNWAFSGCSSLKNFSFGTQVQTIGKEAFSDCNTIVAISSKAKIPPTCGSQALDDINKWECKLYVPQGHVADYQAADQWKEFFFIEEGDMPEYILGDVNDDGIVNGTDIQAIINLIVEGEYDERADVNKDGTINGTDIQEVINIIVNAE